MEPQEITMGQVTYEVRRVFQGSQTVPELIVDRLSKHIPAGSDEVSSFRPRLTRHIPAKSAEAGSSGPELAQKIPTNPPVDGDATHGL